MTFIEEHHYGVCYAEARPIASDKRYKIYLACYIYCWEEFESIPNQIDSINNSTSDGLGFLVVPTSSSKAFFPAGVKYFSRQTNVRLHGLFAIVQREDRCNNELPTEYLAHWGLISIYKAATDQHFEI